MSEPYIRPDVRSFLDQMKQVQRPPMSDALVAMMRQMPAGSLPSMDVPVGELATVRDLTIQGPAGEIAVRLFDPRESREPGPVVVFYHGGGFVVGSIETHAAQAADIARGLDLPVVSVEYRLAPEHPWPAAPDDAEAAARWIADNGPAFDRAFTGIVLCGDSAGGNLVAVTAMALRDAPAALPVILQFAIYPLTDNTPDYESMRLFGNGFFLESGEMAYFNQAYAPDRLHPRSSPGSHDLAGMPPAVIVTASLDPLRDDGRLYARRLEAAGVPVVHREYEGTIHGFASFRAMLPSAKADFADAIAAAREMLERGGA